MPHKYGRLNLKDGARNLEILEMKRQGFKYVEIARQFNLAPQTIANIVENMTAKQDYFDPYVVICRCGENQ